MGMSSEDQDCLGRWWCPRIPPPSRRTGSRRHEPFSTHRLQSKALIEQCGAQRQTRHRLVMKHVGLIVNSSLSLSLQKTLIFLSVLLPVSLRLRARLWRSVVRVAQSSTRELRHQQAVPLCRAIALGEPPAVCRQVVAIANSAEIRHVLLRRANDTPSQSQTWFVEPAPTLLDVAADVPLAYVGSRSGYVGDLNSQPKTSAVLHGIVFAVSKVFFF